MGVLPDGAAAKFLECGRYSGAIAGDGRRCELLDVEQVKQEVRYEGGRGSDRIPTPLVTPICE